MTRKRAIADAFGKAAPTYDTHAVVQARAADALAARIAALDLPPVAHLLELGCGTGLLTRHLARLSGAHGLITDLAPAMAAACRARIGAPFQYVAMDGEAPAAPAHKFHLIAASLVFQWFDHPARAIAGLRALLVPEGWLAFATLGPATLDGWRACHEAEGLPPPTPIFPGPELLLQGWPGEIRLSRQMLHVPHRSGRAFLAALRGLGAHIPRAAHRPLPAPALHRVLRRFEQDHDAIAGYDLIYALLRA